MFVDVYRDISCRRIFRVTRAGNVCTELRQEPHKYWLSGHAMREAKQGAASGHADLKQLEHPCRDASRPLADAAHFGVRLARIDFDDFHSLVDAHAGVG